MKEDSECQESYHTDLQKVFEKVCVYLRFNKNHHSKRVLIFFNIVQIIQIFAIIIPAEESAGMPWCYYYLGDLWQSLKVAAKPSLLFRFLGLNANLLFFAAVPFWILNIVCYSKIGLLLIDKDDYDFRVFVIHEKNKKILKLKEFVEVLCNKFLMIPLIYSFFEHLDAIIKGESIFPIYVDIFIFIVSFVLYGAMIFCDEILLQDLDWNTKCNQSISDPRSLIAKYVIIFSLIFQDAFFSYNEYSYRKLIIIFILGLNQSVRFLYRRPYHLLVLNFLETLKGQVLVLTSVIVFVAEIIDIQQKSIFGPTALFMTYGAFIIILKSYIAKLEKNTCEVAKASSLYEVEHCIRHFIAEKSEKGSISQERLDSIIKQALQSFNMEQILYIWVINYLKLYHEEKDYIKYLLSELLKLKKNFFMGVQVFHCEVEIEIWLSKNEHDAEMMQYLALENKLTRALELDKKVCEDFAYLMEGKEKKLIPFETFVRKLFLMKKDVDLCNKIYKSLTKKDICRACPYAFEYYMGFLRTVMGKTDLLELKSQIKQAEDNLNMKIKNNEDILFIDRDNFLVKVSLENHSLGKIIYCQNPGVLGYSEDELLMNEYKKLVPQPLRKHHYKWYTRIRDYKHSHVLYTGIHSIMILNKNGFLDTVDWKVRVGIDKNKELNLLVSIKPNDKFIDFALFDYENLTITSVTKGFYKFLRQELGFNHEYLNLFQEYNVKGEIEDGLEILKCTSVIGEIMSVRIDSVMIYGIHPIKILALFRLENTTWVNSNYVTDKAIKRQKGRALYEAKTVAPENFLEELLQNETNPEADFLVSRYSSESYEELAERKHDKNKSLVTIEEETSQKERKLELSTILEMLRKRTFLLRVLTFGIVRFI